MRTKIRIFLFTTWFHRFRNFANLCRYFLFSFWFWFWMHFLIGSKISRNTNSQIIFDKRGRGKIRNSDCEISFNKIWHEHFRNSNCEIGETIWWAGLQSSVLLCRSIDYQIIFDKRGQGKIRNSDCEIGESIWWTDLTLLKHWFCCYWDLINFLLSLV